MNRHEALKIITVEVEHGELAFPTSITMALRIQQALDDPDCHIDKAAKLIQSEPLLAARMVALANSVAYNRSGKSLTDVRSAFSRIGFIAARALASAMIARQMAGAPTNPQYQGLVAQLWEHTAHVAALAQVIARHVTHQDADTALFAGVVHEVGGFYLISRAKDFPCLVDEAPTEEDEVLEAEIRAAVLAKLSVPQAVVEAIRMQWQGFLAFPPVSLGDTLLLAKELAPVASPLLRFDSNSERDARIDMMIGQEALSAILNESAMEVETLTSALQFPE